MTERHRSDPRSRSIASTIAGYWKELLGVEVVNPGDDFIDLGGDSVRATMLANRIEDELGVRPEIAELFTTLEQVARNCEALLADRPELAARAGADRPAV